MLYNRDNCGGACLVFDANGLEYQFVTECDDKTGRIEHLVVEGDCYIGDPITGEVLRTTVMAAAPLLIKRVEQLNTRKLMFNYRGCTCKKYITAGCPVSYAHDRDREAASKLFKRIVPPTEKQL